ncbi:GD16815 [Drosophila simulans]|uniref:GD16815 n=1 Tax=Drosophila simulans TaxID=7240 RepID=B4R5P1_DROSI|nr:GD16815 [Drosophila simulans]
MNGMLRRGLSRPEPRLLSMRCLSSATGGGSAGTTEGGSSEATPLRPRPNALTDEIIRVDHAGELGADRIYAGQMAILGNGPLGKTIGHMWEQEKEHRKQFEQLIQQHRVRPTIMTPIWNVAGFVLGAGTALMGEKAAMACTVAVETVIVEHYNDQLRQIMEAPNPDKELLATITKFRDEEQEHTTGH